MKTPITEMFGIDLPIVAFSHCRDVVAAVSKAGGLGVFGASGLRPEVLETNLSWIDAEVDGRPYGVDVLIPDNFAGKDEKLTAEEMLARVPESHKSFISGIFAQHGIEVSDVIDEHVLHAAGLLGDDIARELLDVAFSHPIALIANALGVPPAFMIDRAKERGVPIAALVGAKEHAVKQVKAGVDIIVACGTEAGGHTGQVTTMVLVPEVVEAIKGVRSVPVLAAGGIVTGRQVAAAMALGADGVWTGSVWLTTVESETPPYTKQKFVAATARDTVLTKSRTGKTSRMLKSAYTDAWEREDSPQPLPMPFQYIAADPHLRRIDNLAEKGDVGAQALATYWVGQGVGLMNAIRPARVVLLEMAEDLFEASERVTRLVGG